MKDYNSEKWQLLCTVGSELEADLIKGHLESANIEVQVISQLDSAKLLTLGEQAVVKIYVNADNLTKAEELIAATKFDLEGELTNEENS